MATLTIASATAAVAENAVATTHLNVRSGPGTGFSVVDTLTPGEVVDMTECQPNGWCYVTHSGPDGWVSSSYLTAPSGAGVPGAGCSFQLTIGPGGPEFSIVCPGGVDALPIPAADDDEDEAGPVVPTGNQACFYDLPNFTGGSFCRGVTRIDNLPPAANDRITSVQLSGDARVRLCVDPFMSGFCRNVNASEGQLGAIMNNEVSSLQVYIGIPPGGVPPVLSSGTVTIPNTRRVDLDTGNIGMAGFDLWYRVHAPVVPRLATGNGARIGSTPGPVSNYGDCRDATYNRTVLNMSDFAPGSRICVRTSEGRTAIVRRDGATPSNITLFYRLFDD
ncbi:SH3 domain-containing protein [Rhodobacteraceae bacterium N5(2021)]|uniref:SH3 domain-containing protein n=1 Tax=Gymnodinialimonas phycosphaerae TaxID=2841589 RepID=A0A975YFL2_9RHOB|nr:SH3 domain-containing protein [Gymnodinialimonas phycosphaerae]MBY4894964.1 SH3 domain-containing protein [Gymnodinialimonas phycosphaerae]